MVDDEAMRKEWVLDKKVGADLLSITDDVKLKNDNGLNLYSRISKVEASVLIKDKSSSDLMDAFIGMIGIAWDHEEFLGMTEMTFKD